MKIRKTASMLIAALALAGVLPVSAAAWIASAPADEPAAGYPLEIDGVEQRVGIPVMVPLRTVAESLGFAVTWNGDGTVLIDSGVMHTTITIGEDAYQSVTSIEGADGATAPLCLGAAPFVTGGTTYVPLELFDLLLGSGAVVLDNNQIMMRTDRISEVTQLPNPWLETATLEEAAAAAGFTLEVPDTLSGYPEKSFQVLPSDDSPLLEVLYRNGKDRVIIRKAPGNEEISGDYTAYGQHVVNTVNGRAVTLRGDQNGFALATWTGDGYTYSVHLDEPVPAGELLSLVESIR